MASHEFWAEDDDRLPRKYKPEVTELDRGVPCKTLPYRPAGIGDEPEHGYFPEPVMNSIVHKPLGGPTRVFETGATRDADDTKLDYEGFISPFVLRRYAEYMHRCRLRNIPPGQEMRSSDNWQKGIPLEAYVKSMIRHVMEAWIQHDEGPSIDDDTLCAIMFNTMGYLFQKHKLQVMSDLKGIDLGG